MSLYGVSIKFLGLIRLLSLIFASYLHIIRKRLVTCRSCTVPLVLILSSFCSARYFATKDKIHAVADSAFYRSKICRCVVRLDTIVVDYNTGRKEFNKLYFKIKLELKLYKN